LLDFKKIGKARRAKRKGFRVNRYLLVPNGEGEKEDPAARSPLPPTFPRGTSKTPRREISKPKGGGNLFHHP